MCTLCIQFCTILALNIKLQQQIVKRLNYKTHSGWLFSFQFVTFFYRVQIALLYVITIAYLHLAAFSLPY